MDALSSIKENFIDIKEYGQYWSTSRKEEEEDTISADLRKEYLSGLLKQCEMMNKSNFTAKSWNALMKVYAISKAVSIKEAHWQRN